jgi:hypothetical protein
MDGVGITHASSSSNGGKGNHARRKRVDEPLVDADNATFFPFGESDVKAIINADPLSQRRMRRGRTSSVTEITDQLHSRFHGADPLASFLAHSVHLIAGFAHCFGVADAVDQTIDGLFELLPCVCRCGGVGSHIAILGWLLRKVNHRFAHVIARRQ